MFFLLSVSAVLLQLSFGANPQDCFDKSSVTQVDDSKFPPYNVFLNQLSGADDPCRRACLDQNDKGILVAEGGATVPKFCQLACSSQGVCKLYYQPGITSRRRRGAYGGQQPSGPPANGGQQQWGPRSPDNGYGNQGNSPSQGNNWGPSRTQGSGNPSPSGGNQCWALKKGCPGSGGPGSGAAPNTTAPTNAGANAKCFNKPQTGKEVLGNRLVHLNEPDFDGTLNGCEAKCLENDKCQSVNFVAKGANPAECLLHSSTCLEDVTTPPTANCAAIPDKTSQYWQRVIGCKA